MHDLTPLAQRRLQQLQGQGYHIVGNLLEDAHGNRCGVTKYGRVLRLSTPNSAHEDAPAK